MTNCPCNKSPMTNDNSVTECVFPNLLVRTEVTAKYIVPQLITEQSSRVPGSGVLPRTECTPNRLSVFRLTLFFENFMTHDQRGRVLCRVSVFHGTRLPPTTVIEKGVHRREFLRVNTIVESTCSNNARYSYPVLRRSSCDTRVSRTDTDRTVYYQMAHQNTTLGSGSPTAKNQRWFVKNERSVRVSWQTNCRGTWPTRCTAQKIFENFEV